MVKVLLVEDQELLRWLYSKVLRDHEYEVEIAVDGEDALIKVNTLKPDAIILDIALPRLDGIGVLKILKADPELKKIPIIMFTSSPESNKLRECFEIGVTGYIMKDSSTPYQNVKRIGLIINRLSGG